MPLSHNDVRHIAGLARLKLTDEEVARFSTDLTVILDYINQLSRIDTSRITENPDITVVIATGRPDAPAASLPRNEALKNAPDTDGVYIRVPKVIGG